MKAVFWMGIMVLPNISFTFQAVTNHSAYPICLRSGLRCTCFGEFWVNLGINSKNKIQLWKKEILKI